MSGVRVAGTYRHWSVSVGVIIVVRIPRLLWDIEAVQEEGGFLGGGAGVPEVDVLQPCLIHPSHGVYQSDMIHRCTQSTQ